MEPFDDVREFARAKKFDLIFWIIVMMIVLGICGLIRATLMSYSTLTLSAQPGEITSLNLLNTTVNVDVQVGEQDVQIGDVITMIEDHGDIEITCQDGNVTTQPSNRESDYSGASIWLLNYCKQTVRIDACWYEQDWLRFFLIPLFGC